MVILYIVLVLSCISQYVVSLITLFEDDFKSKRSLLCAFIPFGYLVNLIFIIIEKYKELK